MIVYVDIIGLDNFFPLNWKPEYVLPQAGDRLKLNGLLSEKAKEMLSKVRSCEVWKKSNEEETALRTAEEDTMEVVRRELYFDHKSGEQECAIVVKNVWADLRDDTIIPPGKEDRQRFYLNFSGSRDNPGMQFDIYFDMRMKMPKDEFLEPFRQYIELWKEDCLAAHSTVTAVKPENEKKP